jgi:hypothetical protein
MINRLKKSKILFGSMPLIQKSRDQKRLRFNAGFPELKVFFSIEKSNLLKLQVGKTPFLHPTGSLISDAGVCAHSIRSIFNCKPAP